MNMTETILARAAGVGSVAPGDIATVRVDMAVMLDLNFAYEMPTRIHDPERVSVVLDHAIPAPSIKAATELKAGRAFAARHGIKRLYAEGRQGISHQVMAENGLALPGTVLACGDSHTCASGAFNCAARGVGVEEMTYILCKGTTWFIVYPTVRYELTGRFAAGVYARDLVHHIAGHYGDHVGLNVEFTGPALTHMTMDQRQTITTMCAELSAEFALFPADGITAAYLKARGVTEFTPAEPGPDSDYREVRRIDLATLEPAVVMPHFVPGNVKPVSEVAGTAIDQAFVGSCANARIEDLRIVAAMLKGRTVHPGCRLLVTPASTAVHLQAAREGLVETILEAGAVFTSSTCGACYGGHMGLIAAGERCITSSTRNFKGRMGSPDSEVLMASPATVVASAIEGKVADPRRYL